MFTLLFSLLGGGGLIGAGVLLFLRPRLREAILDTLARVPGWLWAAGAGVLLAGAAWLWVSHALGKAYDRGHSAGVTATDAKWQGAFAKMEQAARQWKTNYETRSDQVTDQIGARYAENLRHNSAAAADLGLRGAGKAAAPRIRSVDHSRLAGGPGGQGQDPARPDAPGSPLPADERYAVVPWQWLVRKAQDHDDLLDEVKAWRDWDGQQRNLRNELVKRLKAEYPDPAFGPGAVKPE